MVTRLFLLFLLLLLALTACQNSADPTLITVEVVREVEVTQFATVQVPVEVTRETYIEVTQAIETVEPTLEPTEAPIGSAENPIHLVFSPLFEPSVITVRAATIVNTMQEATGLSLQATVPTTHDEAIALACADPEKTISFLSALEYVLAHEQCDLQIAQAGVRNGYNWSASMLVVPESAEITTLTELEERTWGVSLEDEFLSKLYFEALFSAENIPITSVSEYESDTTTMIAMADNEIGFATAGYIPPILPYNDRQWVYGEDDPELWLRTGTLPYRSGIGFAVVIDYVQNGGYQVRDARASVLDVRRSIFVDTRILTLSEPIPNDAIAYSTQFPLGLARTIDSALVALSADEEVCLATLCSADFFAWEGINGIEDVDYNAVRFVIDTLQLSEADVLAYLSR